MTRPATRRLAAVSAALAIATAVSTLAAPTPVTAHGGTRIVRAGQSIQAAIDAARPGDRILVLRGTYHEQLTITTDRLELVGKHARLVPPAQPVSNLCSGFAGPGTEAGICVAGADVELADFVAEHRRILSVGRRVEDVSISGFRVRGFSGPNIAVVGAKGARVKRNVLVDGQEYGAITAGSMDTRIAHNLVLATEGLPFIGICMDDVSPAHVSRNVIVGYDISLCLQTQGAEVHGNRVRSTCIGVFVDPGIGAHVSWNDVRRTNPACATQNSYGMYGIVVYGAVGSRVHHNSVVGLSAGGAAVGLGVVDFLPDGPAASDNRIWKNRLRGNDVDLVVDTTGTGNVIVRNDCVTSTPAGLCD